MSKNIDNMKMTFDSKFEMKKDHSMAFQEK